MSDDINGILGIIAVGTPEFHSPEVGAELVLVFGRDMNVQDTAILTRTASYLGKTPREWFRTYSLSFYCFRPWSGGYDWSWDWSRRNLEDLFGSIMAHRRRSFVHISI